MSLRRLLLTFAVVGLCITLSCTAKFAQSSARSRSLDQGLSEPLVLQTVSDHEVFYQKPEGAVKGVLFVAHGCHHSGSDFWPKSDRCPSCLGLPEERRILKAAHARGYAVVAVSSGDREVMCWSTGRDLLPVKEAVEQVHKAEGWEGLPLYALGASSGGNFVLALPSVMALDGICPQIMGMAPRHLSELLDGLVGRSYPPTMFQHMVRDVNTARVVASNMDILKEKGVPVEEVRVEPLPLTPTFFSERVEDISEETSKQIFEAFQAQYFLDKDGFLTIEPRGAAARWRAALQGVAGLEGMALDADVSPIFEELNLAAAVHEIISDHVDAMFNWFESLPRQLQ